MAADKAQTGIAHHGAGEQASFTQDLESVADAEHHAATFGKFFDRLHDRRKAGDRAGAQIVAVGETAGQNDGVAASQVLRLMPDKLDRLFEDAADGVKRVVVAIRAWKDDDSKFHCVVTPGGIREILFYHRRVLIFCFADLSRSGSI